MAKFASDLVMDAALEKIATATRLTVCSAQPADFAGIASVLLAEVTLTPGNGNGDFTLADGDINGRKVTVAQQPNVPITASGTANHVVLDDGSAVIYVTTCTAQALTSGGTVTVPAWDAEIADPI